MTERLHLKALLRRADSRIGTAISILNSLRADHQYGNEIYTVLYILSCLDHMILNLSKRRVGTETRFTETIDNKANFLDIWAQRGIRLVSPKIMRCLSQSRLDKASEGTQDRARRVSILCNETGDKPYARSLPPKGSLIHSFLCQRHRTILISVSRTLGRMKHFRFRRTLQINEASVPTKKLQYYFTWLVSHSTNLDTKASLAKRLFNIKGQPCIACSIEKASKRFDRPVIEP